MPSQVQIHLQSDIGRLEKLLILLANGRGNCFTPALLRDQAAEHGFKIPKSWNVSWILKRSNGLAVRSKQGWEISHSGIEHLVKKGISLTEPGARAEVREDLRKLLERVSSSETKEFVRESVEAFEVGLYRSAVVMSWLSAIDTLYETVLTHHLSQFNNEAQRVDKKWKYASSKDDLARMKEFDFLDRLAAISVIGKNVKAELQDCLKRRNACGHPNSYKLRENAVAHHIETLILNVLEPFTT